MACPADPSKDYGRNAACPSIGWATVQSSLTQKIWRRFWRIAVKTLSGCKGAGHEQDQTKSRAPGKRRDKQDQHRRPYRLPMRQARHVCAAFRIPSAPGADASRRDRPRKSMGYVETP